jgi:uncharacterized protein
MKVINLSTTVQFEHACNELAANIKESFSPDLIIGILTGGDHVGKYIAKELYYELDNKVKYIGIKIQRSSTNKKNTAIFNKIMRRIPTYFLNLLRNLEMHTSEVISIFLSPKRIVSTSFSSLDLDIIRNASQVLIVDDAIDTGATIKTLLNHINAINSSLEVKVAVITLTHSNPLVYPDYLLYNRTIVRFPWSNDVKNL